MDKRIMGFGFGGEFAPFVCTPVNIDSLAAPHVVTSLGKVIKAIIDAGYEGVKVVVSNVDACGEYVFAIDVNLLSPEGLLVTRLQHELCYSTVEFDTEKYLTELEHCYRQLGLPLPQKTSKTQESL